MLRRLMTFMMLAGLFALAAGIGAYLTINLLISSEDVVVVPDLQGKEVVYALEVLSDLKLNIKVRSSQYNASVPKHHVISQDPEPGAEIKQGRDVRLLISKGAQAVVLPNLIGMGLAQARILLAENDLQVGHLSRTSDGVKSREEILAQSPSPGTTLMKKMPVDFLVSSGPPPHRVAMVDLVGLALDEAIETIEARHLLTGHIGSVQDLALADNIIVSHQPKSGYPVALGDSVDLTVNRHSENRAGHRRSGVILFRHRAPYGFLRQHVRIRVIRPEAMLEMFNDFVRPGRDIWLLIPYDQPLTVLTYVDDELLETKFFD